VGLIPVADSQLATVVTTLEMRERPRPRPLPPSPLRLVRWDRPSPDKYRTLFRRVGAPWLWFSRLAMTDAALLEIVHHPAVCVFAALDRQGIEVGMVELDRRDPGGCALAYFGLVPELVGQGNGRWLMAHALGLAWQGGTTLLRVNTCTLDHPRALGFYQASGFVPVQRTIETFDDPRVLGLLPADAAPHVPLLASRRGAA
jgi:GNAT superfamily N-acetyltransferase